MESLKNWMVETANIMFDDSKNDLRSLPKTVRLQILIVLSFELSSIITISGVIFLNSFKISSINLKIDSVSLKIGIIIVNLFII